jgi:uncharacterized iron-regulated membrane protein
VYSIFAFPPVPTQQVTLHIDQYSGKIISNLRFKDFGIIGKIVSIGVAVHEGHFFGTFNLILCLLGCLVIILMSVSGYIMWWKRRPKGKLGAPSLPKNFKLEKGVAVIVIIFGLLFPLVGVSLLVVWVLDWLIIKKIPKVKQWVG